MRPTCSGVACRERVSGGRALQQALRGEFVIFPASGSTTYGPEEWARRVRVAPRANAALAREAQCLQGEAEGRRRHFEQRAAFPLRGTRLECHEERNTSDPHLEVEVYDKKKINATETKFADI